MVVTWPITRERYRQVLMKLGRQGRKILLHEIASAKFLEKLDFRISNLKKALKVLHEKSSIYKDFSQELETYELIRSVYKQCLKEGKKLYE